MSIERWLPWLRRHPLAPLDRVILGAVRRSLTPEAQTIWDRQIDAITRSYCILGKEVNYYTNPHTAVPRFPHTAQEVRRLATVSFEYTGTLYKARIYLVEGRLFSIEFSRDIRHIRKRQDIDVLSVDLHCDPMLSSLPIPRPEVVEKAQIRSRLRGWLAEWAERHTVNQVLEPVPPTDRELVLRQRRLENLPQDYKYLLEQCDGFVGADYTVFGVSNMYEVGVGEEVYWVLAERGGGFIVAREGDTNEQIYFLHHEDDIPSRFFGSFYDALTYLVAHRDLP